MAERKKGLVEELLAALTPEVRALARSVRKLVRAALPRVQEVADKRARVIRYGYGPGYRDTVAALILSRGGIKLGLARGSELPDPRHLLAGSGKVHRHIALTDVDQVGRPGVKALLKAAYAAGRNGAFALRRVREPIAGVRGSEEFREAPESAG